MTEARVLIEDGGVVVDVGGFRRGDVVAIGKGKTLYKIIEFRQMGTDDEWFGLLKPMSGYTQASAAVDRLVKVDLE
jgi:hypothetical protein